VQGRRAAGAFDDGVLIVCGGDIRKGGAADLPFSQRASLAACLPMTRTGQPALRRLGDKQTQAAVAETVTICGRRVLICLRTWNAAARVR